MSDNDGLLSAHERRPRASVCLYTTVYDSGSLNPSTSSLRASVFEFDVRRPVAVQSRDQTGSTHQPEPPYSKRPSLSAGSRLPARLVGVEYMVHLRYIWRKKIGRTRSDRRPLECANARHQRPCRRPLRPERAALALLWRVGDVLAAHASCSSIVESTADDHLTLDSGTNVCCEQRCCDMLIAVSRTLPRAAMQTIGFGC